MQCWIPLPEWEPEWVQVYFTLVAITLFFVPTILISACYIIIVITIWKKGKAMQTTSGQSESINSFLIKEYYVHTYIGWNPKYSETTFSASMYKSTITTLWVDSDWPLTLAMTSCAAASNAAGNNKGNEEETRRASSRGLIPKAKVKTVKMTFVIIFVFILCWSPYMIFDLLHVFKLLPETPTVSAVASFIQAWL